LSLALSLLAEAAKAAASKAAQAAAKATQAAAKAAQTGDEPPATGCVSIGDRVETSLGRARANHS
jgi:hypothetical protein